MGVSTRLARHRHQASIAFAVGLVALSFSANVVWGLAIQRDLPAPKPNSNHLPFTLSTANVVSGAETLELSGRFTENATNYSDSIDWTVKSTTGEVVYSGASVVLTLPVPPGSYVVSGHYGNVAFEDVVSLAPNRSVAVNFVLNAGALRVAPHLTDQAVAAQPCTTAVFAVGGNAQGQQVATSLRPGEILKLSAGHYRVETTFVRGNVKATTLVEVKAGTMRSLNIALHGSLVRLPTLAQGGTWQISNGAGETLTIAEDVTELPLTAGTYQAEAKQGARLIAKSFVVQDGVNLQLSLD